MARPVWTGHITFGLVNVPVVLYSPERRADLNLRLIDSRNDARVRYERINDETAKKCLGTRSSKATSTMVAAWFCSAMKSSNTRHPN